MPLVDLAFRQKSRTSERSLNAAAGGPQMSTSTEGEGKSAEVRRCKLLGG